MFWGKWKTNEIETINTSKKRKRMEGTPIGTDAGVRTWINKTLEIESSLSRV
jgi:hypothetical protein